MNEYICNRNDAVNGEVSVFYLYIQVCVYDETD